MRATRAIAIASGTLAAVVLATVPAGRAWAQIDPAGAGAAPVIETDLAADGTVIGAALAVTALASLWPVDTGARWQTELLPGDDAVKQRFSASAAKTSDLLVTLAVVTPLALHAGQGFDEATGRRVLVYAEAISVSLALNAATKRLVGRPRPYVYSADPRVQAYAGRQRDDTHLSFYSGHAATAFAAAVSGGYLYSQTTGDTAARTTVWASGLLVAGLTSSLRVRAGKHFYSDVLAGAVLGAGVGLAVPLLHYRGSATSSLGAPEWLAIAVAPVAGVVLGHLLPFPRDIIEPLGASERAAGRPHTVVVPWFTARGDGGGFTLTRSF
jgi:membrane-associated phospholipid phosphatase